MSYGMTPASFVQQVYYAQEKVMLDFRSTDDKYREVMTEANLVIQELQQAEDWSWLRKRLILGSTHDIGGQQIPEYMMPEWVYKPATLHDDCVRLHRSMGCHHRHPHHRCDCCGACISEWDYKEVPWISTGSGTHHHRHVRTTAPVSRYHVRSGELGALQLGQLVTFSRPLVSHEKNRIAVTDVIERIPLLHVCDDTCTYPCPKVEELIFTQIPDPSYMVVRTAALHAEGSPPAQGRLMGLQDQAQKILSAMRQNDSAATAPDYLDYDIPSFVTVI